MYLRNFPRASSMRTDLKTLCRFPSSSTAVMLMLMQHLRHLGKGERLEEWARQLAFALLVASSA